MASSKKYDIAVKTGSYTNAQGEEKGRYENVGAVMSGDNGPFLILKRTFNPAGVPNPDDRDTVILSLFEPREEGEQQRPAPQQKGGTGGAPSRQRSAPPAPSRGNDPFPDDDIPFVRCNNIW